MFRSTFPLFQFFFDPPSLQASIPEVFSPPPGKSSFFPVVGSPGFPIVPPPPPSPHQTRIYSSPLDHFTVPPLQGISEFSPFWTPFNHDCMFLIFFQIYSQTGRTSSSSHSVVLFSSLHGLPPPRWKVPAPPIYRQPRQTAILSLGTAPGFFSVFLD